MKDSLFDDIDLESISNKKYKCGDFLSEGAFSKVYICILVENNSKHVVKIQPKSKSMSYAINEINILNKLKKHKSEYKKPSNLINYLDYYIDDNYLYTIFEKCDMDLYTFNIMFVKRYKHRIPLFITKYITTGILNGIYELNVNNLIHCDLKSDNILLRFSKSVFKLNGKKNKLNDVFDFFKLFDQFLQNKVTENDITNSFVVKLIDFNKSQFINQIYKDTNIQIMYYQAPEIVFNSDFNESDDMWSVGCIIFELLTGHQLFDVYNKRLKYGEFYENYETQGEDEESDSESDSFYSSTSGYYDSYQENNHLENYVLLLRIISLIGPVPPTTTGKNLINYLPNNIILGGVNVKSECISELVLKDKCNHYDASNFDLKIGDFIDLLKKIFVYNIDIRVKAINIVI